MIFLTCITHPIIFSIYIYGQPHQALPQKQQHLSLRPKPLETQASQPVAAGDAAGGDETATDRSAAHLPSDLHPKFLNLSEQCRRSACEDAGSTGVAIGYGEWQLETRINNIKLPVIKLKGHFAVLIMNLILVTLVIGYKDQAASL